jgi:hypothetical protein
MISQVETSWKESSCLSGIYLELRRMGQNFCEGQGCFDYENYQIIRICWN